MDQQQLEEARRVLAEERAARLKACWADVQEVLDRHGCQIQAVPIIVNGRIESQIQVVPSD